MSFKCYSPSYNQGLQNIGSRTTSSPESFCYALGGWMEIRSSWLTVWTQENK